RATPTRSTSAWCHAASWCPTCGICCNCASTRCRPSRRPDDTADYAPSMTSYSDPSAEFMDDDTAVALTMNWWLPVVFGVLLILYAFVVLSFTIETVWAVAIGMGVGLILAGIAELMSTALMTSGR